MVLRLEVQLLARRFPLPALCDQLTVEPANALQYFEWLCYEMTVYFQS